jgi:hypothetical protein
MKKGLYANIHAKRKRGEKMRKKGAKGAPTEAQFKRAKQTARKGGVPTKYVRGAKNPKAREAEIKRTARLYKEGKLTPAMMKAISKKRSKG